MAGGLLQCLRRSCDIIQSDEVLVQLCQFTLQRRGRVLAFTCKALLHLLEFAFHLTGNEKGNSFNLQQWLLHGT